MLPPILKKRKSQKQPKDTSTTDKSNDMMLPSIPSTHERQRHTHPYELFIPNTKDFASLCELQDLAFVEKRVWCRPISDCRSAYQQAYEFYARSFPNKLQHCRIIKGQGKDDGTSIVIGACQLQLPGDPGDLSFCADGMRRDVRLGDRHAYLEWIASHPDHVGQGVGTALLQWSIEYCHQQGIHTLSLQVGNSNRRAIRLYEQNGFVTTTQPGDDCVDIYCLGPLYAYCCLGFKHYSLVYMERTIQDAPTQLSEEQDHDSESSAGGSHDMKDSISSSDTDSYITTVEKVVGDNGMERE